MFVVCNVCLAGIMSLLQFVSDVVCQFLHVHIMKSLNEGEPSGGQPSLFPNPSGQYLHVDQDRLSSVFFLDHLHPPEIQTKHDP